MDESWIDLGATATQREAEQIAELIHIEIRYALGLSASPGVSFNYIFSKIGSDYRKPNAVTVITRDNFRGIVWPMPAANLLFIGEQRKKLLLGAGLSTIGDVARADPVRLGKLMGKAGTDIWRFANGDDAGFTPNAEMIGSIGNTITPPADLCSAGDAAAIMYLLATTVCARLKKHGLKTTCVSVSMRDNSFNRMIRQCSFKIATDNVNYVFNKAYGLFTTHYKWERPLRSVGVRADNLAYDEQLALFAYDDCPLCIDADTRLKKLTERFKTLQVEKSAGLKDWWPCAEGIPY
jgi:DNA polymerase-4